MIGFWSPGPKKVSQREMEDVQKKLHDLDDRERADVEKLFRGDLYELGKEKGIDANEAKAGIDWLRENPEKHSLEDDDIDKVERHFGRHLKD